jgi:hypothetical protein
MGGVLLIGLSLFIGCHKDTSQLQRSTGRRGWRAFKMLSD